MYELLEKKGFVYVESRYHSGRWIDFKNKEAFVNDQYLIKNGKVYDIVEEKEAKSQFNQLLLDEFSFILSHLSCRVIKYLSKIIKLNFRQIK